MIDLKEIQETVFAKIIEGIRKEPEELREIFNALFDPVKRRELYAHVPTDALIQLEEGLNTLADEVSGLLDERGVPREDWPDVIQKQ